MPGLNPTHMEKGHSAVRWAQPHIRWERLSDKALRLQDAQIAFTFPIVG